MWLHCRPISSLPNFLFDISCVIEFSERGFRFPAPLETKWRQRRMVKLGCILRVATIVVIVLLLLLSMLLLLLLLAQSAQRCSFRQTAEIRSQEEVEEEEDEEVEGRAKKRLQ